MWRSHTQHIFYARKQCGPCATGASLRRRLANAIMNAIITRRQLMCFRESVSLLSPNRFLSGFHCLIVYSSPLYAIFLDFEIWSQFGNWSGKSMVTSHILWALFDIFLGTAAPVGYTCQRSWGRLNLIAIIYNSAKNLRDRISGSWEKSPAPKEK